MDESSLVSSTLFQKQKKYKKGIRKGQFPYFLFYFVKDLNDG